MDNQSGWGDYGYDPESFGITSSQQKKHRKSTLRLREQVANNEQDSKGQQKVFKFKNTNSSKSVLWIIAIPVCLLLLNNYFWQPVPVTMFISIAMIVLSRVASVQKRPLAIPFMLMGIVGIIVGVLRFLSGFAMGLLF